MDRVSSLSDEVLCHILSFLPTKEAALTSVLAKRWRNLFAFVPNLEFDDSVEEGKQERDEIVESFMDFVDRVLALQGNSTIDKVSIKCVTGVDSDRVDNWICNVLARGVSDLDLCIVMGDRYWLSDKGFKSTKLVKLKIGSEIDLGWFNEGLCLPMLKTLVLESVEFCGDKLQMLLPAFPALEELDMTNVTWLNSSETVSSASLKTLRVNYSAGASRFSFDTPSLVYFFYSDIVAEDYPLANFQNIAEARIDLLVTEEEIEIARAAQNNDLLEDDEDDVALRLGNVAKLVNGIRNVQTLYLTSTTLQVLSLFCESMPVFNKLKFLEFSSEKDQGWQAVPVLLKNSPHLETLSFMGLLHQVTDSCGEVCDCISWEDEGRSLRSCPVKKLEIQEFRGTMREINMIGHFMDYFPCLKEIELAAEEIGRPTQLDILDVTELKVKMKEIYKKSLTRKVNIEVCDILFEKLSTQ